ncbi:MAG: cyclic nucleotide-binding domain-containing protein [Alphaproteobacteria bacterium]|jgi:CRP-like cAMP-binding protein
MTDQAYEATAQPRRAERESFAAGECVFREGEFAMCAYIVESGRVEVKKETFGGSIPVATLGPGELFGEMVLLGDSNRTATVDAVEDTVLLIVNPTVLTQKIENADPVLRRLIKVLVRRLREATKARAEDVGAVRMG